MNSETVLMQGVTSVVSELTELSEFGANISVEAGAHCGLLHVVPVTVRVTTGNSVVSDNVVGVSDPETTRGLVGVE